MNDIRRLMTMVAALHKMGYEQLRLAPAMSPSGMHWRGNVSSAGNVLKTHGAMLHAYSDDLVAFYSSASGPAIFEWDDARTDSPEELARKFIERFPAIAAAGKGSDPDYAAWYAEMLAATKPDGFIYAFADWDVPDDRMPVMGAAETLIVPLPPPGKAQADEIQ